MSWIFSIYALWKTGLLLVEHEVLPSAHGSCFLRNPNDPRRWIALLAHRYRPLDPCSFNPQTGPQLRSLRNLRIFFVRSDRFWVFWRFVGGLLIAARQFVRYYRLLCVGPVTPYCAKNYGDYGQMFRRLFRNPNRDEQWHIWEVPSYGVCIVFRDFTWELGLAMSLSVACVCNELFGKNWRTCVDQHQQELVGLFLDVRGRS